MKLPVTVAGVTVNTLTMGNASPVKTGGSSDKFVRFSDVNVNGSAFVEGVVVASSRMSLHVRSYGHFTSGATTGLHMMSDGYGKVTHVFNFEG